MTAGGTAAAGIGRSPRLARDEGGFAMIAALLIMVLITGLAGAALLLAQMDVAVAGNYRAQRVAEVAADGGVELLKAMIFGNNASLHLPMSVPTDGTAATWHTDVTYADADLSIAMSIKYKQEDTINFNTSETYADEVVRYGQDYNYQQARAIGKQAVYSVTASDARTGTKVEGDLISTIGFKTPGALYVGGTAHAQSYMWSTEEKVEVTAGAGTPALATSSTAANITLETVRESTCTGLMPAAGATTAYYNAANSSGGGNNIEYAISPPYPAPAVPAPTSTNYLHQRVYCPSEVLARKNAGDYNAAREMVHLLFGTGDRNADLNAAYTGAGGGVAGATAANALFKFYNTSVDSGSATYDFPVAFTNPAAPALPACSGVVCYGYPLPTPGTTTGCPAGLTGFECMVGTSFADLKVLADQVITCTATVSGPTGSAPNGCNLSGVTLGTATDPQVVFFNAPSTITLVTNAGTQVSGYGVLVVDGNVDVVGSINWTGLMLVRGNLTFKPWQGGSNAARSGPDLSTTWKGFIMIGGNLDLWTYYGGSIILGYNSADLDTVRSIISSSVPHKVLSWRRAYN
jgi:hypothetical protein